MNSALHRGLDSSFDGIRRTEKLLKSSFSNKLMPVGLPSEKKILDPQGPFLQSWNKIFVLSCVISVSLDPLFFYVPVIDNRKMCLRLDGKVEAVVCILRFFTDLFYVVHIVFQFRTRFIGPSSRVFGRGVLVEDSLTIATRFLRIYPMYKEVTRTSGILIETAWAGAAFNLFLYMLAGHLFGAKSYYKSLHMGKLLCHFRLRLWLSVVCVSPRQRADVLAIHKH